MITKYKVYKLDPSNEFGLIANSPVHLKPLISGPGVGFVPAYSDKQKAIDYIESRGDFDSYVILEVYERD